MLRNVLKLQVFTIFLLQVQEYVEAATFCRFCKTGTLLNLAEINASLLALSDKDVEPLQINVLDYLLGVRIICSVLLYNDVNCYSFIGNEMTLFPPPGI